MERETRVECEATTDRAALKSLGWLMQRALGFLSERDAQKPHIHVQPRAGCDRLGASRPDAPDRADVVGDVGGVEQVVVEGGHVQRQLDGLPDPDHGTESMLCFATPAVEQSQARDDAVSMGALPFDITAELKNLNSGLPLRGLTDDNSRQPGGQRGHSWPG